MKTKKIICGMLIATVLLSPAIGFAQQINPITKAVLDGYTEVLKENPSDYFTLYQRGAQYYQLSLYDQALNDITKAISVTPSKDKDMLIQEYSLLSDIYIQLKEYGKALEIVEKGLQLDPGNYAEQYKKGNVCLYMNNPQGAYDAFRSMKQLKTRSQEASFGMAKAAIMMGHRDEASQLMQEAQDADPSNYITFCRLGDLKCDLGDYESAAADYLSAFSLANDPQRPLESLIKLAGDNYNAFSLAIQYALSRTDNKLPLYFLEGNIALNSGHYAEAKKALGDLLKNREGQEGNIYAAMARACFALDNLDEAQTNIDLSLIKAPSAANYATKAQIELAKGNKAASLLSARKAHTADAQSNEALKILALAAAANGESKEAMEAINEAVMNNAEDLEALMIRGWLNTDVMNNAKAGIADYSRVASSNPENMPGLAWKALAKNFTGKKMDADSIIEKFFKQNASPSAHDLYYAAIYYAQSGNLERAIELAGKAKEAGFQNLYLLDKDETANLNLSPIRKLMK